MIDTSKLKYYKTLCEKGALDDQQKDLDDIINTLEEKQFEYLKRLETAKDEERKDEINELLNTIDLQLKELVSLKTVISSGIIIESKSETAAEVKEDKTQIEESVAGKESNEGKKGKTGLVLAVFALVAVVAIAAVFMINGKNADQSTATNGDTATAEASTNEDENTVKLGVQWIQDIGEEFFSGVYITNVTNQTLIDGGLQPGDRIITINGENARTLDEARAVIVKHNPGDEAVLVVDRDGNQETIKGLFIKSSERLPNKTSGETVFTLDGSRVKVTFLENKKIEVEYEVP